MQFGQLKRRELITLLGGTAAWPLAARAQQPAMPVIGFLSTGSPDMYAQMIAAFRRGLNEIGYVEGQNVKIEYRWAQNDNARLPELAADLVRRPVAVLVTTGGTVVALAAKAATTSIPIVFMAGADPLGSGLVTSLSRPDGNLTGVTPLTAGLEAKRLELLRELVPKAPTIAVLFNSTNPNADSKLKDVEHAASVMAQELMILRVAAERDLYKAFATLAERKAFALLIDADPLFTNNRDLVALLAIRHGLPSIYFLREYAVVGGLMSYGASFADAHRQVGVYVGRILKGKKPADLPVMQPTKFELVINLKTAKVLGLTVPDKLLAIADEVIE